MIPSLRIKFTLFTLALVLATTLAWNSAQGQMPHPNPGMRQPGGIQGMNPPGGIGGHRPGGFDGGMGIGWRCPKCGQTGQGAIPPETCPGCGVRFMNGVGNGSAGGLMGNPPGAPMNPGFNPAPNNSGANFGPGVPSFDDQPQSSSKRKVLIALVVGVILVGIVVFACGAFLVVHNLRSDDSTVRRRRDKFDD
jgi:hypothetical protein